MCIRDRCNDVRHGFGIYVCVDGNRYEGEWQNDVKHGVGKYWHKHTGQVQRGLWVNGNAECSTMEDVCRQAADDPTPYPIPVNKLKDCEQVFCDEMKRRQQDLEDKESRETEKLETSEKSESFDDTMPYWFYSCLLYTSRCV